MLATNIYCICAVNSCFNTSRLLAGIKFGLLIPFVSFLSYFFTLGNLSPSVTPKLPAHRNVSVRTDIPHSLIIKIVRFLLVTIKWDSIISPSCKTLSDTRIPSGFNNLKISGIKMDILPFALCGIHKEKSNGSRNSFNICCIPSKGDLFSFLPTQNLFCNGILFHNSQLW